MNEADITELAAAVSAQNQTPEQIQMRVGQIILGAALRTPIATITSHPNIIGPYLAMCRKNGIQFPPDIVFSPDYHGTPTAITREKAASFGFSNGPVILIGDTFNFYYNEEQRPTAMQGTLAHETVHILANDSESTPSIEERADRCAAQLLGDRQPLITMVEGINTIPRLPHEVVQKEALYGIPENRLCQVKNVDVNDTSELAALITAYNRRCKVEQNRSK